MQRILILGGGVGGTLTANLLVKKLRARIDRGEVQVRVVDATGQHVYQPGFMYIAMGGERAANLQRPERSLLDKRVHLVVGEVQRVDAEGPGGHPRPTACRSATTSSCWRPGRASSPRRSSTSTRRPSTSTRRRPQRACAPRSTGSTAAGSSSGSPACPTSARPRRSRWPSSSNPSCASAGCASRPTIDFCSPIGRAFTIESVSEMATPILAAKGIELHTFFNVEAIDPERKVVQSLEGEELPYDLLILVPPHKGQQFLMDSGLAPAPGGWLPTDRETLQVGGRPNVFALGDATDLPLSKAGSTAHFEAPVVTERIVAAIEGRQIDHKHGDYLGKVMCFFEIGDGKGTLLQFDYTHPPRPPKPNQLWHLGKIVFNKTYWHTVPKGRV